MGQRPDRDQVGAGQRVGAQGRQRDAALAHARGVKVEVSGGVTLATLRAYALAGADLISVGALTHSAPAVDIGLDFAS